MRTHDPSGFPAATPEDDPLPDLSSMPAKALRDLGFHLAGLADAQAAQRKGGAAFAAIARAAVAAGDAAGAVAHAPFGGLAARRRRVDDWRRVALEIAAEIGIYDPDYHTPEKGLERAARAVRLSRNVANLAAAVPAFRAAGAARPGGARH